MNKEQLESLLVSQNPQWQGKPLDVPRAKRRTLFSRIGKELAAHRQIIAVSGPRRVGKSILIRQVLEDLIIRSMVPAQNTLMFQFSTRLNGPEVITELLSLYLAKYANATDPVYIFFDEVQYIDFWQDQLKDAFDQSRSTHFIITGSTSLWYRQRSRESLAGRVIKLRLPVLSFSEYLDFSNAPVQPLVLDEDLMIHAADRANIIKNIPLYETEFPQYLTGGLMPELAVNPNIIRSSYLNDLLDQIVNFDIPYMHAKLDRSLFVNIFRSLAATTGNEFSVNKIATDFGADRRTVADYIHILTEAGFLGVAENNYYRKIRARLSASKKGYMLNPALALASGGFDQTYLRDSRVFGQYAETYAYMRLSDRYADVSFYRSKKEEIDFVIPTCAIEVKTGTRYDTERYRAVANRLDRRLILVSPRAIDDGTLSWAPLYLL